MTTELKPCPACKSPRPWVVRIHPVRWIFTKYYIECRFCHWCGKTKIGKRRAIRSWNKRDGKVLVFTKYGFSICERTVNGRWKGQHANWITHWMPLPEPPQEEK